VVGVVISVVIIYIVIAPRLRTPETGDDNVDAFENVGEESDNDGQALLLTGNGGG
jgi:hypothetical protein